MNRTVRLTLAQARALRIDDLELSVRAANALADSYWGGGRSTLGEAIDAMRGKPAVKSLKNFGPKCARELREVLDELRVPKWLLDEIVPDTWSPS